MNKEIVETKEAPAAIGPYSQAIRSGNLLFISGQISLSPQTGQVIGSSIESQTEQVMKNLSAILAGQGLDFGAVLKTTVYLLDLAEFPRFNEVYGRYVTVPYPARATIQVGRLPKDVLVEIEAIATLK